MPEHLTSLRGLTNQQIRQGITDQTWHRGHAYAVQGRVTSVQVSDDQGTVFARVRGSAPYAVRIMPVAADAIVRDDQPLWRSTCLCPVFEGCKHAVAVLVHLQGTARRDPGQPIAPWQELFDELVQGYQAASGPHEEQTVGIMVHSMVKQSSRYGASSEHFVARLVMPGKSGRWVKTGVQWADLSKYGTLFPYAQTTISEPVQQALLAIVNAYKTTQGASYYSDAPKDLPLHELGAQWFELLQQANAAGVTLVGHATKKVAVELVPEPVLFEVALSAAGSDRVAHPQLSLPAPLTDTALPIGQPVVGFGQELPQRIALARTAKALSPVELSSVGTPVTIPADQWETFTTVHLPVLQKVITVSSTPEITLPTVVPPELEITVTHTGPWQIHVAFGIRYGNTRFALASSQKTAPRDPTAEQELLHQLATHTPPMPLAVAPNTNPTDSTDPGETTTIWRDGHYQGLAVVHMRAWLTTLATHNNVHVVFDGDAPHLTEVIADPHVELGITEDQDPRTDWFDLDVAVSIGGHSVPIGSLISAVATDQKHIFLPSGAYFAMDRPELAGLRDMLAAASELKDHTSERLRISPAHAGYWQELLGVGVVTHQAETWKTRVAAMLERDRTPLDVPPNIQATLRDYQKTGYSWLATLARLNVGGILADDMGLGKTLQILAMLTDHKNQHHQTTPALVVAPTSVVGNWHKEATRFCPDLNVVTITTTSATAHTTLSQRIQDADVVVTSYGVLRLDEQAFRAIDWSVMVIDEAQFVKNHTSKTYKALRRTPANVRFVVTGTPLENSLMDLWSMLSLAAPGLFVDPEEFKTTWARPIESGHHPELLPALRRRIAPLMLRRTKELVAADLPPKQEQLLTIELHPEHRGVYDTHFHRERQRILGLLDGKETNRLAVFKALTALRQLSLAPALIDDNYHHITSAKIETLTQHLQELASEGHRALVFSQFTGFLHLVRDHLTHTGLTCSYLDGKTTRRQHVIDEFRTGTNTAFLISLKAGGVGLTLTEADYVFVLDPWWNPAAEAQAVDRAHRIGQHKPVHVYRMVAANTIEEKVIALQEKKKDLFTTMIDGTPTATPALTDDDIRGLLSE